VPALARLEVAVAAMAAAAATDEPMALADADQAFHAELVASSGSPRLRRMADGLLVETRMCLAALQDTAPDPAGLVAEHRELLEALRSGEVELFDVALAKHMSDAVDRICGQPEAGPAG
jgi:DNA-binding GntR family transcriptional regulator